MSTYATTPDEPLSTRIQPLAEAHEHFERLMMRHQEALVGLDLAEAKRLFEELRCAKIEHMQHENTVLLPVYAECVGWERGGGPELFRAEHDQIYHMMNTLTRALDDLDRPGALTRRAVIEQLDAEKALKGVLEHHALREAFHLFPGLSRLDLSGAWPAD